MKSKKVLIMSLNSLLWKVVGKRTIYQEVIFIRAQVLIAR